MQSDGAHGEALAARLRGTEGRDQVRGQPARQQDALQPLPPRYIHVRKGSGHTHATQQQGARPFGFAFAFP